MAWNYGPFPKLSGWEIREIQRRARVIFAECPIVRKGPKRRHERDSGPGERQYRLACLADEYGVSLRTVYRYLERAA